MGGYGSGRSGSLPVIEHGLKLDLRSLRQRGLFRPDGNQYQSNLQWTNNYSGESVANIGMNYCTGSEGGWIRLTYTSTRYGYDPIKVNETILLTCFPQPYGGHRWYFICPATRRRCQCLYLPSGATYFRSRKGFGVRLKYKSQNLDRASRLMETGRRIAARVLRVGPSQWREKYSDWDFPPKPPWMRWKTYNRHYARWEWYEERSNAYLAEWVLRLGG